jgi:hypothetical protein
MPRDFNRVTNSLTIRQLQDGIVHFEQIVAQAGLELLNAQQEAERCQKEYDRMVVVLRGYVAELREIEEATGRKFASGR